jgi:hypothetical protein
MLGNSTEYRGSFIRGKTDIYGNWAENFSLLDELNGELVSNFLVGGALIGEKAAIYISKNAFVKRIVVISGAQIEGDIISDWNPKAEFIQSKDKGSLKTNLDFGLLQNQNMIFFPDPSFDMKYNGNITAAGGMNVSLFGGKLAYSGQMTGISQFYLGELTNFCANAYRDNPVVISAEKIILQPNSKITVDFKDSFAYSRKETALLFESNDIALNSQNRVSYVGKDNVSIGFYDNFSANIEWDKLANGAALNLIFTPTKATKLSTERTAASAVGSPLFLAVSDWNMSAVFDKINFGLNNNSDKNDWNIWLNYGSNFAASLSGLNYTAGINKNLSSQTIFGFGAHSAYPKYNSHNADVNAESLLAFIYGSKVFESKINLSLFASAGHNNYSQNRRVENEHYYSEYGGTQYILGAKIDKTISTNPQEKTKLDIFAEYEYIALDVDAYNENNEIYALKFGNSSAKTHRINIGAQANNSLAKHFNLNSKLFYSGLYGDRNLKTLVKFTQRETESIISQSDELDKHSIGASVNLNAEINDNANIGLNYMLVIGKNYSNNQIMLNFAIRINAYTNKEYNEEKNTQTVKKNNIKKQTDRIADNGTIDRNPAFKSFKAYLLNKNISGYSDKEIIMVLFDGGKLRDWVETDKNGNIANPNEIVKIINRVTKRAQEQLTK